MSNYSENLTLTIPIALRETGKRLSRAFDPTTLAECEAFCRGVVPKPEITQIIYS